MRGVVCAFLGLAAAGCSLVGTPKAPPGPAPTVAGAPGGTDAREGSERAEGGPRTVDLDAIPDAVPRIEPLSRYGNPPSYEVFGKTYHTLRDARGFVQEGMASWYGQEFHGRRTSSGEPYDMFAMTAAHRELPLPTYVRVTNLENGRSVVVRVNDRGPFHDTESRIIDLSYAAAYKLRIIGPGTARVRVEAIVP